MYSDLGLCPDACSVLRLLSSIPFLLLLFVSISRNRIELNRFSIRYSRIERVAYSFVITTSHFVFTCCRIAALSLQSLSRVCDIAFLNNRVASSNQMLHDLIFISSSRAFETSIVVTAYRPLERHIHYFFLLVHAIIIDVPALWSWRVRHESLHHHTIPGCTYTLYVKGVSPNGRISNGESSLVRRFSTRGGRKSSVFTKRLVK